MLYVYGGGTTYYLTGNRWQWWHLRRRATLYTGQVHPRSDGDTMWSLRLARRHWRRRHSALWRHPGPRRVTGSDVIAGNDVTVEQRQRRVDRVPVVDTGDGWFNNGGQTGTGDVQYSLHTVSRRLHRSHLHVGESCSLLTRPADRP